MSELIKTQINTPDRRALFLHEKICQNAALAASALGEMAKALKQMRDEKLYKHLGFETFGDYVEKNKDYSFKERQAYTYIKAYEDLGERFLQSNAELGITKLSLLSKIPAYEREEFVKENDLPALSAKEVEELIKEKQDLGEQLSLICADKEQTKKELTEQVLSLKKEIEELKKAPVEVSEQPSIDDEEIERRISSEVEQALSQEKEKQERALKLAKTRTDNELKKLTDKHRKELAEQKKATEDKDKIIEQLKAERQAADRQAAEQINKLKSKKPDEVKAALNVYFDEMQKSLQSFINKLNDLEDKEQKQVYKSGTIKWLNSVIGQLEK